MNSKPKLLLFKVPRLSSTLPRLEFEIKERLSCSYRLILFWNMSNSPELGLTLVFDLSMERTTGDNYEHDYPRWRTTPPKTWSVKHPWNRIETPSDCVHYPFILLSSQQRSKPSKIVGWFSQNHRTANPARAEPHIIWQRLLFFLPPSHRSPRALFFFLRGLCGGQRLWLRFQQLQMGHLPDLVIVTNIHFLTLVICYLPCIFWCFEMWELQRLRQIAF